MPYWVHEPHPLAELVSCQTHLGVQSWHHLFLQPWWYICLWPLCCIHWLVCNWPIWTIVAAGTAINVGPQFGFQNGECVCNCREVWGTGKCKNIILLWLFICNGSWFLFIVVLFGFLLAGALSLLFSTFCPTIGFDMAIFVGIVAVQTRVGCKFLFDLFIAFSESNKCWFSCFGMLSVNYLMLRFFSEECYEVSRGHLGLASGALCCTQPFCCCNGLYCRLVQWRWQWHDHCCEASQCYCWAHLDKVIMTFSHELKMLLEFG